MTIDLATATGTRPRITVVGVGGAGGNAIDDMVAPRPRGHPPREDTMAPARSAGAG